MSQIVRIRKTQMAEREYLLKALSDLGLAWQEGGRLGLSGPQVEFKIRGQNVGFRKAGGVYEMMSTGSPASTSKLVQQLTQRYVYHLARAKLEAQGFTLAHEEVGQGQQIHLVLRRMA